MLFVQWACNENVKFTNNLFCWTMRFYKDAPFKVDGCCHCILGIMVILMSLLFVFPDRITTVKTDIYVTSFGPVSDTDMVSGFFFFFAFICHRQTDSIPLPSLSVSWTSTSQIFQAKNHLPRQEQDHLTNHRLFTCRWASKSELIYSTIND